MSGAARVLSDRFQSETDGTVRGESFGTRRLFFFSDTFIAEGKL